MQANQLKRIHPNKKRMTVARGGKRGKTAGRGGKGQSARAGNKRRPEWRDIIKRVPKLRGRGKNSNKSFQDFASVINLEVLETTFVNNDSVTPTILIEKGLISKISGKVPKVKILGNGDITKVLKISGCSISGSAREKVVKAHGSIEDPKIVVESKIKAHKIDQSNKVKAESKTIEKVEKPKTKKTEDKAKKVEKK